MKATKQQIRVNALRLIFSLLVLFPSLSKADKEALNFAWVQADGTAPSHAVVDRTGRVTTTGFFHGAAKFGTIVLTNQDYAYFMAQFNPHGNCLWALDLQSAFNTTLAVDKSRNDTLLAGYFDRSLTLGTNVLTSPDPDYQGFLARYNAKGDCLWAKKTGSGSQFYDKPSVSIDGSGNAYLAGCFLIRSTFGTTVLTATNGHDIYLAKYNGNGNQLWALKAGKTEPNSDLLNVSTSIDSFGNIFLAGSFNGIVRFETNRLVSTGDRRSPSYEVFVAKFTPSGTCVWARKAGGQWSDFGNDISSDSSGNVYVVGSFSGSARFGTNVITGPDNSMFIAKYNTTGDCLWIRTAGVDSYGFTQAVAVDEQDNLIFTGSFQGQALFGNMTLIADDSELFVAKYDSQGTCLWAKATGGINETSGNGIAVQNSTNIFITGNFDPNYPAPPIFGSQNLTNSSGGFLAKMTPVPFAQPAITTNIGVLGSAVKLAVTADGGLPLHYQWFFNEHLLRSATNSSYVLSKARFSDSGSYTVVVTNTTGASTSHPISLLVIRSFPVADAGTDSNLVWRTGGNAPWIAQSNFTHNGRLAAESGVISHNQESWLETTVTGPGNLSFWCKVSSQFNGEDCDYGDYSANYVYSSGDALAFLLDKNRLFFPGYFCAASRVFGETEWQQFNFEIPAGTHVFRWRYFKDGSISSGYDTAWLDEVHFTPVAPSIMIPKTNLTMLVSSNLVLKASVTGTPPFSYQWFLQGNALPDGTNSNYSVVNAQTRQSGEYVLFVTNAAGFAQSDSVHLEVEQPLPLESLFGSDFIWHTGQSASWFAQTNFTHDGNPAAQSGFIRTNQQSWIETTILGPGILSFWWKVSTSHQRYEDNNLAYFPYNFLLVSNSLGLFTNRNCDFGCRTNITPHPYTTLISDDTDWTHATLLLLPGTNIVRWSYVKDKPVTNGLDAAWLSDVHIIPVLTSVNISGPESIVPADSSATFSGNAVGTAPLSYQWLFEGNPIPDATNVTLTLLIVQKENAGSYSLIVSNGSGSLTSSNVFLNVGLSLAESLGTSGLVWTSGGFAPWYGQTNVTHDGTSAAQSGIAFDPSEGKGSWLQTTVTSAVPIIISFHYHSSVMVPSYLSGSLQFYIFNEYQPIELAATGDEWREQSYSLPAGTHVLRWKYNTYNRADVFWIDDFRVLGVSPSFQAAMIGSEATITANFIGENPVYQWLFEGNPMVGETNQILTKTNLQLPDAGRYSVVISNSGGILTSSNVVLSVHLPLAEALDTPELVWRTGGTKPWHGQPSITHDGIDAGETGLDPNDFHDGEYWTSIDSWLETTITGPGDLTFWWKCSSAYYDLTYSTNGSDYYSDLEGNAWTKETFSFDTSEPITFRWLYQNSAEFSNPHHNAAWLDEVRFAPRPAKIPKIIVRPLGQTLFTGVSARLNVVAEGTPPLRYRWKKNGVDLQGETNATLVFADVQLTNAGQYSVIVSNAAGFAISDSAMIEVKGSAFLWAHRAGGQSYDFSAHATTDAAGNIYVTGSFQTNATFGDFTLSGTGLSDIFLAKYDSAGQCLWAKSAGGTNYDSASAIAVDNLGHVYVSGVFESTSATFGSQRLVGNGKYQIFLAQYDEQGNCLWAQKAGGGGDLDQVSGVATDISGNVFIVGVFSSDGKFGSITLTTNGYYNCFLAKYDLTGNCIWATGKGSAVGSGVAADTTGNVYLVGSFSGTLAFSSQILSSTGNSDAFIARFDPNGNCLWARGDGGTGDAWASGVAADASGNVFITGGFFFGDAFTGTNRLENPYGQSIFLARYDADGNCLWSRRAGGDDYSSSDYSTDVAIDAAGAVYLTGTFANVGTFGSVTLTSSRLYVPDLFVAQYNRNGDCFWAQRAESDPYISASNLAVDRSGSLYLTGSFSGHAKFGGRTLTSAGGYDVFLAKLPPRLLFTAIPQDQTVPGFSAVTLRVGVSTALPVHYQWQFNGANIPNATNAVFKIPEARNSDSGNYTVIVTGPNGSQSFNAAVIVLCNYKLSAPSSWFAQDGGTGALSVTASSDDCSWQIINTNAWISILSNSSATGDGIVQYLVSTNFDHFPRAGIVTIGGKPFLVVQNGLFAPTNLSSKTFTFTVTNGAGILTTNDSYLFITDKSSQNYRVIPLRGNLATNAGVFRFIAGDNHGEIVTDTSTNELKFLSPRTGMYFRSDDSGGTEEGTFAMLRTRSDFNSDQRADLLWQNTNGLLAAWFMDGTNFLGSGLLRDGKPVSSGWRVAAAADFGDSPGNNDLLFQNLDGRLGVWQMNGSNITQSRLVDSVSREWRAAGAADFNNDGIADILFQHRDGRLAERLMTPDLQSATTFLLNNGNRVASTWRIVGVGDFNDDDQPDILWQNRDGRLAVWKMVQSLNTGSVLLRNGRAVALGWRVVALNDCNNDGQLDIIFQNDAGTLAVWFMSRTDFLQAAFLRKGATSSSGWRVVAPK
jgi:hypothetical protein